MFLLIINPGSTSTKIAVYEDEGEVLSANISHTAEELAPFDKIVEQKGFRKDIVLRTLKDKSIEPAGLAAVIGRGGLLNPIPSGVYRVNDRMLADLTRESRESTPRTWAASSPTRSPVPWEFPPSSSTLSSWTSSTNGPG